MKFVEPKVYFLGVTKPDLDEVKKYLVESNNEGFISYIDDAIASGVTPEECLISMFAKLCYKSLTVGQNPNITRVRDIQDNLRSILDTAHGCYDDETEVLTADGWKKWVDVSYDDYFATRSPIGNLEYYKPKKLLINQKYSGRMYRVSGNQVDLLVTPNHNMYVCKTTTVRGRKRKESDYKFIKAQELNSSSYSCIKTANWINATKKKIPKDILALLGFAIGDGNLNFNTVRFHLRRQRKISYLRKLCEKIGWKLRENKSDCYNVSIDEKYLELFKDMYDENQEKVIPQYLFLTQPKVSLEGLFDGLINSDGSVGKTSLSFDSTSQKLIKQVQQLALHIGCSASVSYTIQKHTTNKKHKDVTRLQIIRRGNKPEVNKFTGCDCKSEWIENWNGKVHCVEVPNNTLYVKRNGIPVWCGNSILEHIQFNFLFTNVSRVFTHELVRHRIGTCFSQTSGRYVRLDEIELVLDPILEPIKRDVKRAIEDIETYYKMLVDKSGVEHVKDFTTKKKLTSALRRIAPNGLANEIAFSVNLRAIRHIILLRTARHAEWEIRKVFGEVYNILAARYPIMFEGAKVEMVDGFPEVSDLKMQPYDK